MVSVAYGNDFRPVTSHTVAATLNKSMGAHSLKTGMEIAQYGERSTLHRQRPERPVRVHQHLHAAEQRERHGLPGPAGLRLVPPGHALHHVDHASPDLRRVLQDLRVLRAGRLAGQQQADPEPRPALRGRKRAGREGQQERLRLRLRLRPADRGDGPGELRGAQERREHPGDSEGARAAVEREGRPDVRGCRRRERPLQDAEEHLPAAGRVGLPVDAPRRSSAAASGCSPASSASGAAT